MLAITRIPTDFAKDANGEDDEAKPTGLTREYEGRPSATVRHDRVMSGEGQDNVTVLGPRHVQTPSSSDTGLKVPPCRFATLCKAQIYAGCKTSSRCLPR